MDFREDVNDATTDLNSETAWLEMITIGDFRVWHLIAFGLGILLAILIIICCCFRFRIPRTKQEIEADHQRKQIRKKFREKLKQIKNSEMTNMDLQKAMEYIQANYLLKPHENDTIITTVQQHCFQNCGTVTGSGFDAERKTFEEGSLKNTLTS